MYNYQQSRELRTAHWTQFKSVFPINLIFKVIVVNVLVVMITWKAVVGCLLVSCLWGCTNPFIKHAQQASATSYNAESVQGTKENVKNTLWETLSSLKRSMMNIKVMAPFVLNQMGSAVFFLLLSTEPVSIVSPVCNSLTFLFTAITSYAVFKEHVKYPWMLVVGIFFILCGTALCI